MSKDPFPTLLRTRRLAITIAVLTLVAGMTWTVLSSTLLDALLATPANHIAVHMAALRAFKTNDIGVRSNY